MNKEQQQILELLDSGKITATEAERLLSCLEEDRKAEIEQKKVNSQRMKGKKLRVQVDGFTEKDKNIHVNVSVPLVIARYADNILSNCIPKEVSSELKEKGFDLSQIKLGELIDTFESLDEDIVNVDLDQDGAKLKVRVYVE